MSVIAKPPVYVPDDQIKTFIDDPMPFSEEGQIARLNEVLLHLPPKPEQREPLALKLTSYINRRFQSHATIGKTYEVALKAFDDSLTPEKATEIQYQAPRVRVSLFSETPLCDAMEINNTTLFLYHLRESGLPNEKDVQAMIQYMNSQPTEKVVEALHVLDVNHRPHLNALFETVFAVCANNLRRALDARLDSPKSLTLESFTLEAKAIQAFTSYYGLHCHALPGEKQGPQFIRDLIPSFQRQLGLYSENLFADLSQRVADLADEIDSRPYHATMLQIQELLNILPWVKEFEDANGSEDPKAEVVMQQIMDCRRVIDENYHAGQEGDTELGDNGKRRHPDEGASRSKRKKENPPPKKTTAASKTTTLRARRKR